MTKGKIVSQPKDTFCVCTIQIYVGGNHKIIKRYVKNNLRNLPGSLVKT